MVFGVDLQDAREEVFVRMVCDGIALGVAFMRAGYKGSPQAAHNLFHLPRVQERANAILAARRETAVVTLPEVTDMLQRVFAGAHAAEEYSAAHNAAFSLARLYGHVTDKSTLEVIRRPSRDPDAPSEQALEAWALSLPVVSPEPQGLPSHELEPLPEAPQALPEALEGPPRGAPAGPLGPGPDIQTQGEYSNDINWLGEGPGPQGQGPGLGLGLSSDFKGLGGERPGETGNGAPSSRVTGAPHKRGRSDLLEINKRRHSKPTKGPGPENRAQKTKRVPGPLGKKSKKRKLSPRSPKIPSAKDLFG